MKRALKYDQKTQSSVKNMPSRLKIGAQEE